MMLQGHFISSLLANEFRDSTNSAYVIWEYFRGITAPTFFTVTGFVFLFLVLKQKEKGWDNIRVKKGIIRGLKLIAWGYILRFGIGGLLMGYYHDSYFYTDVLQIIGISLIFLCLLYVTLNKYKIFGIMLLGITIFSFLFERVYDSINIPYLPTVISHYFTKANGAVFSIFPWFGYVSIGGYLAIQFLKFREKKNFYTVMPMYLGVTGVFLLFLSSPTLHLLYEITGIEIFFKSGDYNYLFSRLGDVFILFTLFVYLRNFIKHPIFIQIGKVTLSIYIVHHLILYCGWFGIGIVHWFHRSLTLTQALLGAVVFMIVTTYLVLTYRDVVNNALDALKLSVIAKLKVITYKIRKRV